MKNDQVPFGQVGSRDKMIRVLIADDFKLLRDMT